MPKTISRLWSVRTDHCKRVLRIFTGMIRLRSGVYKWRKLYRLFCRALAIILIKIGAK